MAKTISFINNKGGVAKTTSTVIIGELLAYLGYKVLVVDLDEQVQEKEPEPVAVWLL